MDSRAGEGEGDGRDHEKLHPRVKEELEKLNQASDEINKLENELDDARSKFSATRNDSTQRLNISALKIKHKVIKKARPYYEAKEKARKAQVETLKAARQFQSANGIHRAAKETISLAEQKLSQESACHIQLSSEWQEMFNHATIRLMEAEKEKRRSEEEHHRKSNLFSEAEQHMNREEKKHKRSITRARSYFELKFDLQTKLELIKVAVEDLHKAVADSKKKYSEALNNLEVISNEVHDKRKSRILLMLPREPGVGAECDSQLETLDAKLDSPFTPADLDPPKFRIGGRNGECSDSDNESETGSVNNDGSWLDPMNNNNNNISPTLEVFITGCMQDEKSLPGLTVAQGLPVTEPTVIDDVTNGEETKLGDVKDCSRTMLANQTYAISIGDSNDDGRWIKSNDASLGNIKTLSISESDHPNQFEMNKSENMNNAIAVEGIHFEDNDESTDMKTMITEATNEELGEAEKERSVQNVEENPPERSTCNKSDVVQSDINDVSPV